MQKTKINRNIYYYDLYALYKENGAYDFKKSFSKITDFLKNLYESQKDVENYADFLRKSRNNDDFFVIVDAVQEECIQFRIVLCRVDALPFIEKGGELESLGKYIDSEQNIAEVTHCVYFPKYGILGGEYNFSGARPSSIADYIRVYGTEDYLVTCHAKLNYDAYKKLVAGEEYSLFDFSVRTNSEAYIKVLSKKTIFSAMQATVPESDTFEIIFKKQKTKKNKYTGFNLPLTEEEIKLLLENNRDDIERFIVSQAAFNEKIDLLADKLVHKVSMVKTSERTIDSNDMYKEICNYFNSTVVEYCKEK